MKKRSFLIPCNGDQIPAVFWEGGSDRLLLCVHGNLSHKEDTPLTAAAEKAVSLGYGALSFDLPGHGGRGQRLSPQACIPELQEVYRCALTLAPKISLFACSIGAYFSLLAYRKLSIEQALFLAPIVNMEKLIHRMMSAFGVGEERLFCEKRIPLPIGETLDWDYFRYVQTHPVSEWGVPTSILYGDRDTISEQAEIEAFCRKYGAQLTLAPDTEHYFHTLKDLSLIEDWLAKSLQP